jgi:hypothetical protein
MKMAVIALCAIAAFGCAPRPEMAAVSTGAPEGAVAAAGGWQPGEVMVPERRAKGAISALNSDTPSHRKGVTAGGREYTVWPDGSGSVGDDAHTSWHIDCSKDVITDKRDCTIKPGFKSDLNLVVMYRGSAIAGVCIAGHDFPGRTGAIRIDSGVPVVTNANGCVDGAVAHRLAKGKSAVVRFVKWPSDHNRDVVGSLDGLAEALELVRFIQSNIDRLTFGVSS